MVVAIFVVSVLVAFGVSYGVARLAKDVVEALLSRSVSKPFSAAGAKYLRFAIVLVGISSGSRVRLLEDFIGAPGWNREALTAQLTPELWVAAMYHTVVDSLEGIAWLFIIVALILLVALWVIRKAKPEWLAGGGEQSGSADETERVSSIR